MARSDAPSPAFGSSISAAYAVVRSAERKPNKRGSGSIWVFMCLKSRTLIVWSAVGVITALPEGQAGNVMEAHKKIVTYFRCEELLRNEGL